MLEIGVEDGSKDERFIGAGARASLMLVLLLPVEVVQAEESNQIV